jgi:hypothetical protein
MIAISPTYEYQPSFLLGFHGCDADVGEKILRSEGTHLAPSKKDYDWLGHGIYFWEGNPARAMEWAQQRHLEGMIKQPFVLGAIVDLKHCLDLFDSFGLAAVKGAHKELIETLQLTAQPIPKNVGHTPDKAGRKLDCAVINFLHESHKNRGLYAEYDSVRGPFLEGDTLFPTSGFRSQNHIQLCVRNTACIKGYFRPMAR